MRRRLSEVDAKSMSTVVSRRISRMAGRGGGTSGTAALRFQHVSFHLDRTAGGRATDNKGPAACAAGPMNL